MAPKYFGFLCVCSLLPMLLLADVDSRLPNLAGSRFPNEIPSHVGLSSAQPLSDKIMLPSQNLNLSSTKAVEGSTTSLTSVHTVNQISSRLLQDGSPKRIRFSTRIKSQLQAEEDEPVILPTEPKISGSTTIATTSKLTSKRRVSVPTEPKISGNTASATTSKLSSKPRISVPTEPKISGNPTGATTSKNTSKPRVRRIRVFQLANVSFPADNEVKLSADFYPGVKSGNVVIPTQLPAKFSAVKLALNKTIEAPGVQPCTSRGERAKGFCFALSDVIFARSCVNMSTTIAHECSESEVCCFSPNANRKAAEEFDKAPCGIRRPANISSRSIVDDGLESVREEKVQVEGRIVNSILAEEGEICWQAALMLDSEYVCGGAIINSRHVITAAHCVQDVDNVKRLRIRLGHQNVKVRKRCSESFEVSHVTFHDQYDPLTFASDLAIIKLAAPITNSNCSCRVCLPDVTKEDNIKGDDCIVTGYGTTQPDSVITSLSGILNVGKVSVLNDTTDHRECTQRLKKAPEVAEDLRLESSMVCAIGSDPKKIADTCDLDSGSPLACTSQGGAPNVYTLVGVSSWGLPCGTNDNALTAQQPPLPSVYAGIRKSMGWLQETISNSTMTA